MKVDKTQLFNVEQWYYNSNTKLETLVAVIHYGKPFALARFLKRLEDLKDYPKGTFFKLPKYRSPLDIEAERQSLASIEAQEEYNQLINEYEHTYS